MSDQFPVSRREALIAASTATAIGVVTCVTNAGDSNGKYDDARSKTPPLKLKITLTDGEIVTLNAAELTIDFGANGQLLVKPNGFLPVGGNQGKSQHSDNDSRK